MKSTSIGARASALFVGAILSATLAACASGAQGAASAASSVSTIAIGTPVPVTQAATASTGQPLDPQPITSVPVAAAEAAKINLNTASPSDFLTIPGVGDRMVREFQEYRPYTSIQTFRREIGKYVDAQTVAAYEKYVYVPVLANEADLATLEQLPGVDTANAQALIAARPYSSTDAFLARLGELVTPEQLSAARAYLG